MHTNVPSSGILCKANLYSDFTEQPKPRLPRLREVAALLSPSSSSWRSSDSRLSETTEEVAVVGVCFHGQVNPIEGVQ